MGQSRQSNLMSLTFISAVVVNRSCLFYGATHTIIYSNIYIDKYHTHNYNCNIKMFVIEV